MALSRSAAAQAYLRLGGRPYSLVDYPPIVDILDKHAAQSVFIAGRQISKSTILSVMLALDSLTPHWLSLYIGPSQSHRNVFSASRLSKLIHDSPIVADSLFREDGRIVTKDDISHKMFSNGSEIILNYASDDPSRVRGVSTYKAVYDEIQDINYDAVVPVINETLSASKYGTQAIYAGTPKTMENRIQHLWETSDQRVWLVKCPGCSKHNVPGMKNIGLNGFICAKCGKGCSVRTGFWYPLNPATAGERRIRGYHMPQIIFPMHTESPMKWAELKDKLDGPNSYDLPRFKNEVMGLSESLGARMITRPMLEKLCTETSLDTEFNRRRYSHILAGVDWAGEGRQHKSLTALWIWGVNNTTKRPEQIFYKLYTPGHPMEDVDDIATLCRLYDVDLIAGDAGNGLHANAQLRRTLGDHRVVGVRMLSSKKFVTWDHERMCYNVDKTTLLDTFFLGVKREKMSFLKVKEMHTPFEHFLAEYEEVTQNGEGIRVWRRTPGTPDDLLFSAVFGWLMAGLTTGEIDLHC